MYNEFWFEIALPGTPSTQLAWASGIPIGEHLELYYWAEDERLMVVDTLPAPSSSFRYEAIEMIDWTETSLTFRHDNIKELAKAIQKAMDLLNTQEITLGVNLHFVGYETQCILDIPTQHLEHFLKLYFSPFDGFSSMEYRVRKSDNSTADVPEASTPSVQELKEKVLQTPLEGILYPGFVLEVCLPHPDTDLLLWFHCKKLHQYLELYAIPDEKKLYIADMAPHGDHHQKYSLKNMVRWTPEESYGFNLFAFDDLQEATLKLFDLLQTREVKLRMNHHWLQDGQNPRMTLAAGSFSYWLHLYYSFLYGFCSMEYTLTLDRPALSIRGNWCIGTDFNGRIRKLLI
ncbi:hypothetical protein GCM10008938_52530 [Deinococcus roseus]|uniref:Uncharacterized protein n=1 Tax=Deinococcus roseus TaxID=392414 RepID=A0ABQ2DKW6_9DEIO|nr:hypothetical protein GCM10008938_52530 [Deinococcus roseus]